MKIICLSAAIAAAILSLASAAQAQSPGRVVAWRADSALMPVPVEAQSGVTAIAAGRFHSVALKNDGTVVAWGQAPAVPAGLSGVTAISAGGDNTVALKNDGTVVAWGTIYDGTNYVAASVPVDLGGVKAIAAGGNHTVALKNDGSVVAWGNNEHGQTSVPAGLSGVTAIAAGWRHTVALKNDGSVVAWGLDDDSGLTTVPAGLSGVTAIAAGKYHTVALLGTAVSLNSRASGNELILSWPTNAAGFTLQSALNLAPPVTWIDSTITPAVIGAKFTVTNTISGNARFYRLRKR